MTWKRGLRRMFVVLAGVLALIALFLPFVSVAVVDLVPTFPPREWTAAIETLPGLSSNPDYQKASPEEQRHMMMKAKAVPDDEFHAWAAEARLTGAALHGALRRTDDAITAHNESVRRRRTGLVVAFPVLVFALVFGALEGLRAVVVWVVRGFAGPRG